MGNFTRKIKKPLRSASAWSSRSLHKLHKVLAEYENGSRRICAGLHGVLRQSHYSGRLKPPKLICACYEPDVGILQRVYQCEREDGSRQYLHELERALRRVA